MKHKDYDDDLLVELIARGEMSYAEIAERVGLGRSTVRRVAEGKNRPDLRDKIYTAMRTCLADRHRRLRSGGRNGRKRAAARRPGARKKDYDEDLLVDLIARGEMSYGRIAERIGLGRATVGMIARAETRPDLQEKINTAMRRHLADKRRRPTRSADETGIAPPAPTGHRNKDYDDDLLVELIGRGNLNYRRIANRIGLSPKMIGRIARGQSRRDLQPRIAAIAGGIRQESHRLGARWLRGLLIRHIRDGLEGTGKYARKCREFAMNFIENHTDSPDARPIRELPTPGLTDEDYQAIAQLKAAPPGARRVRGLSDLSPGLQKQILEELGGPCDDWMFIDHSR